MSIEVIGHERVLKPRKEHHCYLCSLPIQKGEAHDRWCCVDSGSISRLRVHDACKDYAHDCIEDWTNGDGVEPGAVETDLWERLTWRASGTWLYGVNEKEVTDVLTTWPGLAALVEKIRADVKRENKDQEPGEEP